ncbi:hypothetical protein M1N93_02545 [Dehalococcoidia bacterium]|nr:hypothetical protein [Dehalococcoidia bacterium]
MKHTRGPWHVELHNAPGLQASVRDKRNICICTFSGVDAATKDEDEANARLVAAAPDLFHWCRQAEHYIHSRSILGGASLTESERWLLKHLRETIAKTEGIQ